MTKGEFLDKFFRYDLRPRYLPFYLLPLLALSVLIIGLLFAKTSPS